MSGSDVPAGAPAAPTVHRRAAITRTQPLTVRTPERPWSYAVSLPLDVPAEPDFVVEVAVRVGEGCVGVSCTGADHRSLVGEVAVRPSDEPVRLELFADSDHAAYLLIRTWAEPGPAVVEVHSVRLRALSAEERAVVSAVATLVPVPGWSRYYGTSGDTLVERVRVRDYLRLAAPVRRSWIEGLAVVIQPDDQLSRALYVSGLYEPNTMVLLKRLLTPGSTFFDIGAHAGLFTIVGSKFVGESGRVFSFEPSVRERARLDDHVAINGLSNVTVIPAAVGGHNGHAMLKIAAAKYGGLNTLGSRFAYDGVEADATFEVEVVTLDRFVERAGVDRVHVIKLDIEGAECSALRGAAGVLRDCRPALIVEVVSSALQANGVTPKALQDVLLGAGYLMYRIDDEGAVLEPIAELTGLDEQNIVALPRETRSGPLGRT